MVISNQTPLVFAWILTWRKRLATLLLWEWQAIFSLKLISMELNETSQNLVDWAVPFPCTPGVLRNRLKLAGGSGNSIMLYFPPNELGKWSQFDGCIYFSSVLVQPPTIVCKLVEIHPAIPRSFFFNYGHLPFFSGDFQKKVPPEGKSPRKWRPRYLGFLKSVPFFVERMRFFDGEVTVEHGVYHVYVYLMFIYKFMIYIYENIIFNVYLLISLKRWPLKVSSLWFPCSFFPGRTNGSFIQRGFD